jgi:hypothetical protein
MNTSSTHINYEPFKLSLEQVNELNGFSKGRIPKGELSASGRGTGAEFETSTLLWKKFSANESDLIDFENYLYQLTAYYHQLATSLEDKLPKQKPFKDNSFIVR